MNRRQSTCRKVRGRSRGPERIQVNAVRIRDGKKQAVFSIITYAALNTVMRAMQVLRDSHGIAQVVKSSSLDAAVAVAGDTTTKEQAS